MDGFRKCGRLIFRRRAGKASFGTYGEKGAFVRIFVFNISADVVKNAIGKVRDIIPD